MTRHVKLTFAALTRGYGGGPIDAMHYRLPTALSEVLVHMVPNRPESFDELRALYADDVVFQDPIQIVRGWNAFREMNERLLGKMKTLD